jgi:uncharacterized protein YdaU (DUF1376 family)
MKSPAFQYYPKDFLSDARVMAMSLEERGAYWTLVSVLWLEKNLKNDPRVLSKILGVTPKTMAKLWVAIGPCFIVRDDGTLSHNRLEHERLQQSTYSASMSDNGRKGGRPRLSAENPQLFHEKAEKSSASASASASALQTPSDSPGDAGVVSANGTHPPPPTGPARTSPPNTAPKAARRLVPTADEAVVFAHYKAAHPKRGPPDDAQIRKVRQALGTGYTAEELCRAVDGNKADPWHAERRKHELTYVLRDNEHIDHFLELDERENEVVTDDEGNLKPEGRRALAVKS